MTENSGGLALAFPLRALTAKPRAMKSILIVMNGGALERVVLV
jgi:hypothetical protein